MKTAEGKKWSKWPSTSILHLYYGILLSNKKEQSIDTYKWLNPKKKCWKPKARHQTLYYPYKVEVIEIRRMVAKKDDD